MKFEIKKTRGGEPYGRFVYTDEKNVEHQETFIGNDIVLDAGSILKLIAYLVEYLKGIL
jgi:hypothetical protein